MSASRETSVDSDGVTPAREAASGPNALAEFLPAFALYAGWSALAWFSRASGTLYMDIQAARVILLGIGATNLLFFMIARINGPDRPPADTIALAQCVVGIAWATLFTFMSSGPGELVIGIYTSVVLFAMFKVRRAVLNQLIIFAASSYAAISIIKMLATEPPAVSPAGLLQLLAFSVVMLCLSTAGRHAHRRLERLETALSRLREGFQYEHAGAGTNSVNRRYILELLSREKGRTDRTNVPFCICIFNVDHNETATTGADAEDGNRALKRAEAVIRAELRDMDSLNATGFHDCFGAYSDREFVAILSQTNLAGARRSAKRILTAVSAGAGTPGAPLSLSAGIAEYRRGEPLSALLARAEEAAGRARTSEGGQVHDAGHDAGRAAGNAEIVRLETRRRS